MFVIDDLAYIAAGAVISAGVGAYFSEKSARKQRERQRVQYNKDLTYEAGLKTDEVRHTVGDVKEKIRSRTLGGNIREGTYESALTGVETFANQKIHSNLNQSLQQKPKKGFWDWFWWGD